MSGLLSLGYQAFADGSVGAPTGVIQFPTLLNAYAARPAWNVPGTDYYVGIDRSVYPTNANLKNPSGSVPAGVTVNSTSITISNANTVFDGYDCSLSGGRQINVNADNCTISNCYYLGGSNGTAVSGLAIGDPSVKTLTITKCIFDGNKQANNPGGLIALNQGSGGVTNYTLTYNHIRNGWSENLQMGLNGTIQAVNVKWNLFENSGWGAIPASQHGDQFQYYTGSGATTVSVLCNFNNIVQNDATTTALTQGVNFFTAGGNFGSYQSCLVNNNVGVTTSGANMNYPILVDNTWLTVAGGAQVFNNYYSQEAGSTTGPNWSFIGLDSSGGGGSNLVQIHGNVNMITGTVGSDNPGASGWVKV